MTPKVVRAGPSQVEIFDRVLDKGIVIDAWARVSVVGIELLTVDTRVVVASIATYFEHSDALAQLPNTGAPARRVSAAGASATPLSLDGSRTAEPRLRIHGAPARLHRPRRIGRLPRGRRGDPRAPGAQRPVELMRDTPLPLERTCPKCGRDVTDQDHHAENAELALARAEGRPGGGMVQAWQHKKCPTGT